MKLTEQKKLQLENAYLKRELANKNVVLVQVEYDKVCAHLDSLIKEIGGKEYKEGLSPNINFETNELLFKEK